MNPAADFIGGFCILFGVGHSCFLMDFYKIWDFFVIEYPV